MIAFDENGFSQGEGSVVAYACYEDTHELIGPITVSVQPGFGLPANAYLDVPPPAKKGMAIVRAKDSWVYVNDYRGQHAYAKKDGAKVLIESLGELDEGYTLIVPAMPFDEWDGQGWVENREKAQAQAQADAEETKSILAASAEREIAVLTRAVRLGMATQQEKTMLDKWERYSVYLSRLDTTTAPDITWPEIPAATV